MKVLFEKDTYRLLGTQIVGFDGVDKRIDVGGEISHIGIGESRLFLINQSVKHRCFLHFLSFGAIPRLNYGFCVRDPTPLSGPEGHRDSDRPTVIGTQPYASPPFMLFTSHWTKNAQVVRFFEIFFVQIYRFTAA